MTVPFEPSPEVANPLVDQTVPEDATCSFGWIKGTGSLFLSSPRKPSVRYRGSVFHAHADYDEHRIVLLRAALDWRHGLPWRNGKRRLLRVSR